MRNASKAFKNELNNENRRYIKTCTITLADGTELKVDNSVIWNNGFRAEDAVSNDGSFDIGSAIIGKFTLTLNNIYEDFSDYDFTDAVISNIRCGLKLPDETTESVSLTVYTVDEARYNGSINTLECLDNMHKFDRPYSESNLTYPSTLGAIVRDACTCCGVSLAADSASFEKSDAVVEKRPDDSSLTFRQVLCWVGQMSCHWLRCNAHGQLTLGWYDQTSYEIGTEMVDAGSLDERPSDTIDAGTFSTPKSNIIDAGNFSDRNAFHHIYSLSHMDISTDDVVITGIRVRVEDTEEEEITYQTGQDGYVLSIEDNKLIQGNGMEIANYLGERLIGLRFRPLSVRCLSDPTIEAGDLAYVTDRKGNTYTTLITSTTFRPGNYQKVECSAETPKRNSATRYSQETKIYQEFRKKIQRNKTEWEKAVHDLSIALASSSGLFITKQNQEDGSDIYYMHNKKTLSESDIVWKLTAEAFGISTDGGKTYPFGFKVTGEMIAKILNTIGINANWINTGALVVKDAAGNVLFLADVDNHKVEMNVISLKIQGLTVEEIAQREAESVANEVIEDLQEQIDGKIQSYDQTTDPSTYWALATYADHIGDIWKNGDNLFRWDGSKWKEYGGNDAVARKLAESRATVFISTPVPPYKTGDMWITSTQNGKAEHKACIKTRTSGSYVSTDWASPKYTDDSAVTALDTKLNTPAEIVKRLTNNGKIQGVWLDNNQLYISAEYIISGVLRSKNGKLVYDLEKAILYSLGYYSYQSEDRVVQTIMKSGGLYLRDASRSVEGNDVGDYGVLAWVMPRDVFASTNLASGELDVVYQGKEVVIGHGVGIITVRIPNQGAVNQFGSDGVIVYKSTYDHSMMTEKGFYSTGDILIEGDFECRGSKNRVCITEHYGERLHYCYETASPFFGDVGFGRTDENGVCIISIDPVFSETAGETEYHVFLQSEGTGTLYVPKEEKRMDCFTVRGTPNTDFSWELKCNQKDYEYERMQASKETKPDLYFDVTDDMILRNIQDTYNEMEDTSWRELNDLQE